LQFGAASFVIFLFICGARFAQELRHIPFRPQERRHGFGSALAMYSVTAIEHALRLVQHGA
jgi:hypothetical protein